VPFSAIGETSALPARHTNVCLPHRQGACLTPLNPAASIGAQEHFIAPLDPIDHFMETNRPPIGYRSGLSRPDTGEQGLENSLSTCTEPWMNVALVQSASIFSSFASFHMWTHWIHFLSYGEGRRLPYPR